MNALSKLAPALAGASLALASSLSGGVALANGTVSTQMGQDAYISATTTEVGYPWNAKQIAACSWSKLYALNEDQGLWVNNSSGADSGWTYVTTPQNAATIACDGQTLIAVNRDNTIWRLDYTAAGAFTGWTQYARATNDPSPEITGGNGVVVELDSEHRFYTSTGFNDTSSFPGSSWTYRGTPQNAAWVTGAMYSSVTGTFFARNVDHSLWISPMDWQNGSNQPWYEFNISLPANTWPDVIASVSTGRPTVYEQSNYLYILDNTKHLWQLVVDIIN